MTVPNRATLWGDIIVDELVAAGVEAICVAPGSRSTPLAMAAFRHQGIKTYSILDERSMAYFSLGRARATGEPTPIITTSGTATANCHPAVIEASQARVPMVVLTADRPAELQDSGANQTIDQTKLYGNAVRDFRTLPEPRMESRTIRSVRTSVAQAVATAGGNPAGPVHLNVPVKKPLEPVPVEEDVPPRDEVAVEGRDGPFVEINQGTVTPSTATLESVIAELEAASRPLIVAGPADSGSDSQIAIAGLAETLGAPILADPLSSVRFGPAVSREGCLVCGGYDAYLNSATAREWPAPDVVVRVGASPTSKPLRKYLAEITGSQILVDPGGDWREAEFTATHLVGGAVKPTLQTITDELVDTSTDTDAWVERFEQAEAIHWDLVDEQGAGSPPDEGSVLHTIAKVVPEGGTLFVSNSMPVRDLDRYGRPAERSITALGNRGASGIDGIVSSALGAGSVTDGPLVAVVGDLAYYHDMNGLLSVGRCGVDVTIVLINNDGGGIFHKLPIAAFDPPFTEAFKTPHGIDFEPTGDLYGLEYVRAQTCDELHTYCEESMGEAGGTVIEVQTDASTSTQKREELAEAVQSRLFE